MSPVMSCWVYRERDGSGVFERLRSGPPATNDGLCAPSVVRRRQVSLLDAISD